MILFTAFSSRDFSRVIKKKTKEQSRDVDKVALLNRTLIIAMFGFMFFNISTSAYGGAYYISPNGSNSNSGTSSSPWKTFNHAIPELLPGDALILKNGIYSKSTTGLPTIICGFNAERGKSGQPITIKAENERQAFLESDGSAAALLMKNCSYWNIEGLRGSSADLSSNKNGNAYSIFQIYNSTKITLKGVLASHNNRYFNTHAIAIAYSSDVVVEGSEAYYFHRHGISFFKSHNVVSRRNYVNSRNYNDILDGYKSRVTFRGDEGIVCYSSYGCIIENSISEGNDQISAGRNGSANPANMVLGSISLDEIAGIDNFSATNSSQDWSEGGVFENVVAIGNKTGSLLNSVREALVKNATFYRNGIGTIAAYFPTAKSVPDKSVTYINVLSFQNKNLDFAVNTQAYTTDNWLIEYSNGGAGKFYPSSGNIMKSLNVNPSGMGLGQNQCIVYVPSNSNMKGAGKDGEDIGANIIYRYQNGMLTGDKLWDQTTGEFPCGAIVSGLNDDPVGDTKNTRACRNVHKRLNVGVNGCPIP